MAPYCMHVEQIYIYSGIISGSGTVSPGVKFLYAEHYNQDPWNHFFGQQRAKGGRNDNPTVTWFCDAAVITKNSKIQLH